MKAKQIASILGLSFESGKLGLCLMQRSGGRLRVGKSLTLPLTLDPLNDEPELVGREIRNHLDEAGIHERHCAVCLPLKWMLTLNTELPDLAKEDLDSFITLQAERSFPFSPEDLSIAESRIVPPSGGQGQATLVAFSRHSLDNLQSLLKAAELRPLVVTVGIATLPMHTASAVLLAGGCGLDLAVFTAGGVAAVRPLNDAVEHRPEGPLWDFELIARQVRITLGRLPQGLRGAVKTMVVHGAAEYARELAEGLRESLAPLGLAVQEKPAEPSVPGAEPAAWSPAYAVAACCLSGKAPVFDFLPPRVSRIKQLAGRISARRALYLVGSSVAIVLIVGSAFMLQGMRLSRLEREWAAMEPKVKQVEKLQAKVRAFRPWFDSSAASLTIAARIASAFPDEGTVWAKKIEVKDLSSVTCTGNARSNEDWLKLLESLRKTPGIADLQVTQVRGNQPLQFSLSFTWKGDAGNAL